jgi:hypothetical protein
VCKLCREKHFEIYNALRQLSRQRGHTNSDISGGLIYRENIQTLLDIPQTTTIQPYQQRVSAARFETKTRILMVIVFEIYYINLLIIKS